MSSVWELEDQDDDDELDVEPPDLCDRCGAVRPPGCGMELTVAWVGISTHDWFWCDECADSFTAWRLTKDAPLPDVADELADGQDEC